MNLFRRRPPSVPGGPSVHVHARAPLELPAHLLRRLEFKVLRRLDGFLFGDYRGLFYGPSLDLAEVREYQPGDEARRMDWNVTARTTRLHVRQYREERELTAWLLIDASPSMNFGTKRALKRDVAREFAGLAALIITRRGDKIGAVRFGDESRMAPPRTGRAQALAVLQLLSAPPESKRTTSDDARTLDGTLRRVERTLRRRSLVFVVSDFLHVPPARDGWALTLGRLAARHDVIAVRVSDPAERELPDVGAVRMRDPESGEELWIDTSDPRVREAHAKLVLERDQALHGVLRAARVDLIELDTRLDVIAPLLRFARSRGRRGA